MIPPYVNTQHSEGACMGFPRTVDEITPEWLTSVLRDSGVLQQAKVQSLEHVPVSGGLSGDVNRVSPIYVDLDGNEPNTLIAKFANTDETRRLRRRDIGNHLHEVGFYRHASRKTRARTAECYFADTEEKSGHYVLLLEDVGTLRTVSQFDGCSLSDAYRVMDYAAALHGSWWGDSALEGFDWLGDLSNSEEIRTRHRQLRDVQPKFLEIVSDRMPSEFIDIFNGFVEHYVELLERLSKPPLTISHGDFRLANIFFDDIAEGADSVLAVDWEVVSRLRPSYDVATFIVGAFDTETRRQNDVDLFRAYHDNLLSYGVTDYRWEEFRTDLQIGLLARMAIQANVLTVAPSGGPEVDKRRVEWICDRLQMVLDWNCDEVIPR